jgi:hypothetical protein
MFDKAAQRLSLAREKLRHVHRRKHQKEQPFQEGEMAHAFRQLQRRVVLRVAALRATLQAL